MVDLIGPKASRLFEITKLDIQVPKLHILTNSDFENKEKLEQKINRIIKDLNCDLFAVRSNSFTEDSLNNSQAGQFKSYLKVPKVDVLIKALDVFKDGEEKGASENFSVIIQEFINFDYSGVIFTRNPIGKREAIIEYHKGIAEDLVSGKIIPQKIEVYFSENKFRKLKPYFLSNLITTAQKLEDHFDFPQDIEWGIKGSKLYIVQSRDITTITRDQFEEYRIIDNIFAQKPHKILEKTKLYESCPRPTTLMISLLNRIFENGGPVWKTYNKFGVNYTTTSQFVIVGNELYTEVEEEIKSILPSEYIDQKTLKQKIHFDKNLFLTIKNFIGLLKANLSKDSETDLVEKLKKISQNPLPDKIENLISDFLNNYEVIFSVNFISEKVIKNLEALLKNQKITILDALSIYTKMIDINEFISKEQKLIGNTIDISDETPFKINLGQKTISEEGKNWFFNLNTVQKQFFEQQISKSQTYEQLRELARYSTVRYMSQIRTLVRNTEKKYKLEKGLMNFASIEEITTNKFNKEELKNRKTSYLQYSKFTLPTKLTCKFLTSNLKQRIQGVSPGDIEGILTNEDDIENYPKENLILYTQNLTPNLTKYFGKIKGIISANGGLLSHMAIVAREFNIPTVVGITNLKEIGIKIGDKVHLEGSSGLVTKI